MKNKRIILLIGLLAVLAVVLTGCVPGSEQFTESAPLGFFWGLWHGMIAWISFFISLFAGGDFTIYEANNRGWLYNLGFLLGVGAQIGGFFGGVRNRIGSRRRRNSNKW